MDAYLKIIQDLSRDHFALTRIPRSENTQADALAVLTSSSDSGLRRVILVEFEFIEHPSIGPPVVAILIRAQIENAEEVEDPPEENVDQSEYGCDSPWLEPIRAYIINGTLPTEKWAARKIKTQAARYVTVEGEIYKWRFFGPLMTCAEGEKARRVMEEVHSGSCGNHSGGRSLAVRANNPSTRGSPLVHLVSVSLHAMVHGYRRAITQLEAETLPPGPHGFLLKVGGGRFLRKYQRRTTSYGRTSSPDTVPYEMVTENGSQFISTRFEALCEKWKIRLTKSTPRYLQCNGQAETINKTVLDGLKKRLEPKKGRWAEELEGVLWSHRTTPRRATGETPFDLVYGTECMIPVEVEFPGVRRRFLPEREDLNSAMLLDELDLINERRDQALIRIQNYQHAAAKYYNSNVRHRRFKEGDLDLHKVFQNTVERNAGKLGAYWEGPYKVIKVVRPASYQIVNMQGVKIQRTWNAMHLKKYYH
ncbi:uncharacterized protein LOC125590502 [Brassica napus]|uniref:uncharacterized protein LOC125590502 n=1 Tax=Brassica napus TaxID=3708 RepID=UPI0006AA5E48|nr:uncharacterized protein LOC125590502 [Brassica napus]